MLKMNELDKDIASYEVLKLKLNNLLQFNNEATTPKFVIRDHNNKEVEISSNVKNKRVRKANDRMNLEQFIPFLNQTQMEGEKGISAVKVSIQTVCIIVVVMMIATCCCTLYLRNRLMALVHKITRKRTKESKLLPVDIEKGKGESNLSSSLKKLQKTETKLPGNDATRTVTRSFMTTTSSVQAEPSSTTCCKCFKKKKKKVRRKRKR